MVILPFRRRAHAGRLPADTGPFRRSKPIPVTLHQRILVLAAILLVPSLLLFPSALEAQQISEMQFTNQPITDILLALGQVAGKSIIPDETVRGDASYYFTETDFEAALQVFLSTYKMYFTKEGNIYYVSRIRAVYDPAGQLLSLDAEDVSLILIIRAAAKAMGKTILFDPLPSESITVHVDRVSPARFLEILMKRFPAYTVETDPDYLYVKRVPPQPEARPAAATGVRARDAIRRADDRYSLSVDKMRFQELIDEFFTRAEREYSLLIRKDAILENLRFEDKSFEQLLRLLLEQANADYTVVGGIHYIFEISERDVLKKLKSNLRLPLTYISVKEINNLIPPELLNTRLFKIDEASNSIVLSGSLEEIGPIQDFLKQIDRPLDNLGLYRFDLDYVPADKVKSLLPPSLRFVEPTPIPQTNSIIVPLPPDRAPEIRRLLELADRGSEAVMVKLKYIKAKELIEKLPPSLAKEEITETVDPTTVFVRTSPDKLEDFFRELKSLDRPLPLVRYHVLVVQYQEGESLDWSDSLEISPTSAGSGASFLGVIGQLLSLNFDIVSTFGYQFALKLNANLNTKKARVLADTTLIGLSDQEISFQNTDTFRYRELEVDENGDLQPTGVSREISAGLIFRIKGWVSGNDMVSMNVSATVSKRGADTSSTLGSLPTTSEQVVNTQVRTFSGEPVVIGGLIRQEKNELVTKVPVLGDIPVLGYLFQSRSDSIENTELVVYIVPRVDYSEVEETDLGLRLERLYEKFVSPLQYD